jgi:hypothetical protein
LIKEKRFLIINSISIIYKIIKEKIYKKHFEFVNFDDFFNVLLAEFKVAAHKASLGVIL